MNLEDREMTVVAITFVKCEKGKGDKFYRTFAEEYLDRNWENTTVIRSRKSSNHQTGKVRPVVLVASAGYFDFVIVAEATSTYSVSEFCMHVLRSNSKKRMNRGNDSKHIYDADGHICK